MKAQRTGQSPPVIENLGDETFYYNFDIEKKEKVSEQGDATINFEYHQVRCSYPVDRLEIQQAVNQEQYNHTVTL